MVIQNGRSGACHSGIADLYSVRMEETVQFIKTDFHIHTSFSRKVTASPEEMYQEAKKKGLDRIAVTDHNTIKGAQMLHEMDPEFVIIGEEITWAAQGEVIGLFLEEAVPEGRSMDYTLDALLEQNAFIFIPHPFAPFYFYCPPHKILTISDRIDAIEVRNGRNLRLLNSLASCFSLVTGMLGICGSDAHAPSDVGKAGMDIPEFHDAASLRESLITARPFGSGLSAIDSLKLLKRVI